MERGRITLDESTITASLIWTQDGGRKENKREDGLEIAGIGTVERRKEGSGF